MYSENDLQRTYHKAFISAGYYLKQVDFPDEYKDSNTGKLTLKVRVTYTSQIEPERVDTYILGGCKLND